MQGVKNATGRYYIAIDLKSFYASVEAKDRNLDPLKVNLVVADESRTDKTICLAVSPTLKAYGLSGRSRLFEVRQKAKEVEQRTGKKLEYIVAPPRMARYMEVAANIYEVYMKFVSEEDIHVYSIDEVFIDVTNYLSLYQMTPRQLAVKMIQAVEEETGITATGGISSNLYLCKVAMDIMAKHVDEDENGVRIAELSVEEYRRKLWEHQPLTDFWRVGPGIARQLQKHGMYTMGDVARVSFKDEQLLYKIFGIDAEILIDHAWGYEPCTIADIKAYKPSTNSFSSGQVLQCPYMVEKARIVVREMVEQMVLELVEKEMVTPSITLTIGYDRENVDSGNYQGEVKIDHYGRTVPKSAHGTANFGTATSSTQKITDGVLELYDRIVNPALLVRRITMSANQVTNESFEQYDLFTDYEAQEKEKKLQKAMLDIQRRFGKNSILKGTNLQEGATMIERNGQIGGHKA